MIQLLTPLPSTIAKLGDLIERDVTSDIEINQEALFPLETIPFPIQTMVRQVTGSYSGSFLLDRFEQITNAAALTGSPVFTLQKGLWIVDIRYSFWCNYSDITLSGFQLGLVQPDGQFAWFVDERPRLQSVSASVRLKLSVLAPLLCVITVAANGIGQTETVTLNVLGNKYL